MKLPKENIYVCEYGCFTVTVDVDEGVTPFMIPCRERDRPDRPIPQGFLDAQGYCDGTAQSMMYPRSPRPPHIAAPKWEWYKPTDEEFNKMGIDMQEHITRGGLDMRPRTDKEPLYHEEVQN